MRRTLRLSEKIEDLYSADINETIARVRRQAMRYLADLADEIDIEDAMFDLYMIMKDALIDVYTMSYISESRLLGREDEPVKGEAEEYYRKQGIPELIQKHETEYLAMVRQAKQDTKETGAAEQLSIISARTGIAGESGLSYKMSRILRTEGNAAMNRAAINAYKDHDIRYYKYISMLDDSVCQRCHDLDGKAFPVDKAKRGKNLPPLHPNCRCWTEPVRK